MSDSFPRLAASFEQVVREREGEILRTAYRVLGNWADAEDVAQETFIRLHRHGLRFENDKVLRSWLYRVAVNLCLDKARSSKPFEELAEVVSTEASVEAELIVEQKKRAVMAALVTLPPRERAAVVLREIEELPTAEVAAILGSSDVTVRSQVSKAVAKLRSMLDRRSL